MKGQVLPPRLLLASRDSNLDGVILNPRIPNNFLTRHGAADNTTPRISTSTTIGGCLTALNTNIEGATLYIYEFLGMLKTHTPTLKEVPDADLTGEHWILEPWAPVRRYKVRVKGVLPRPYPYIYYVNGVRCIGESCMWDYDILETYGRVPYEVY